MSLLVFESILRASSRQEYPIHAPTVKTNFMLYANELHMSFGAATCRRGDDQRGAQNLGHWYFHVGFSLPFEGLKAGIRTADWCADEDTCQQQG